MMSIDREKLIEIASETAINLINKFGIDHYGFDADAIEQFAQRVIELATPRIREQVLREAAEMIEKIPGAWQLDYGTAKACAGFVRNMAVAAEEAQHVAE